MSATVWRGDEDITDQLSESQFSWERNSGDPVGDESWNTSSKAIGHKSVVITPEDVVGRTVFACHVEI
jgi:predicted phosphatase